MKKKKDNFFFTGPFFFFLKSEQRSGLVLGLTTLVRVPCGNSWRIFFCVFFPSRSSHRRNGGGLAQGGHNQSNTSGGSIQSGTVFFKGPELFLLVFFFLTLWC